MDNTDSGSSQSSWNRQNKNIANQSRSVRCGVCGEMISLEIFQEHIRAHREAREASYQKYKK